jgi:hypothetical protein
MQIVNGSQTVHSLFDAYSYPEYRDRLSDVYLLVRIYATEDRELGQEIATFTNTQNPVKSRDTRSNDERQRMLAEDLGMYGYGYQRKKHEDTGKFDKDKIIDSEKLGQLILSFYHDKAGDAKNKKTVIFDKEYELIFDTDKINAKYVLLPYIIYQEIEKNIKAIKKEKKQVYLSGVDSAIELFENEKDYQLHSLYYTLLTCRYLAIRSKIDVKYDNLDKIIKFIPEANKIIKIILDFEIYKNKDPAEVFKQNSFAEELVKYLDIVI